MAVAVRNLLCKWSKGGPGFQVRVYPAGVGAKKLRRPREATLPSAGPRGRARSAAHTPAVARAVSGKDATKFTGKYPSSVTMAAGTSKDMSAGRERERPGAAPGRGNRGGSGNGNVP